MRDMLYQLSYELKDKARGEEKRNVLVREERVVEGRLYALLGKLRA